MPTKRRYSFTPDEDEIVRTMYPTRSIPEVLRHLRPGRGRSSLITRAHRLGVVGKRHAAVLETKRLAPTGSNRCVRCTEVKSFNDFYGTPGRHGWTCKTCLSVRRYNTPRTCLKHSRAAKSGLPVSFLLDLYSKQAGRCYYSDLEMTHETRSCPRRISVDRIDSNKPYSEDNVVLCCFHINRMKMDASVSDFVSLCTAVATHANQAAAV